MNSDALKIGQEYLETIQRVLNSESGDLIELARVAKLDLRKDLQFRNLSGLDFGTADLRNVSLRGADLSESKLDICTIDETTNLEEVRDVNTLWPPRDQFRPSLGLARVLLQSVPRGLREELLLELRSIHSYCDIVSSNSDSSLQALRGMTYIISDWRWRGVIEGVAKGRERVSAFIIGPGSDPLAGCDFTVTRMNFYSHGATVRNFEFHSPAAVSRFIVFFIANTFSAYFAR